MKPSNKNDVSCQKPTVFVGSSTESLQFAKLLRKLLSDVAKIELWAEVFELGESTIEGLFRQLNRSDYAILIVTNDDLVESRGNVGPAPRDNIIFEAGFFMARLGRKRTLLLCDEKARPKLPTDLAGITYATFDSQHSNMNDAMRPAIDKFRGILSKRSHATEVDFIRAYLTVIHKNIKLSDTYADILRWNLNILISEINRLKIDHDWHKLIEVKERIREFFEYSGRYEEGAQMGSDHVLALRELEMDGEALWALVKDEAYMLILADRHEEGRDKLIEAIERAEEQKNEISRQHMLFYAYRYMGISYMREQPKDLPAAKLFFEKAKNQVQTLNDLGFNTLPLRARIERNIGHLGLEWGNHPKAIERYDKSLKLFMDAKDQEHVAITHLAIAKAILKSQGGDSDVDYHLNKAQHRFDLINWIEGLGRVLEQRALAEIDRSKKMSTDKEKTILLKKAKNYAESAFVKYKKIRHLRMMGRIDRLLEEISEEIKMRL